MGQDLEWLLDPSTHVATAAGLPVSAAQANVFGTDKYYASAPAVAAGGDWQTVSEEENLRRAILRRCITTPGTYKTKPSYGVGLATYVKKPITRALLEEIQLRIKAQVGSDRRVDAVVSCTVTQEMFGDQPGIRIVLVVQALGRTLRPVSMLFRKTG